MLAILRTALPLTLAAGSAMAQALPETQAPDAIVAQLAAQGTLDGVKAWAWDFDRDGATDYLVQAAYPFPGGNAVQLGYYAFVFRAGGYVQAARFDLTGGIAQVMPAADGLTLEMYVMRDGDPRCCPSGRKRVNLLF